MALNTVKCNCLTPLHFKGLNFAYSLNYSLPFSHHQETFTKTAAALQQLDTDTMVITGQTLPVSVTMKQGLANHRHISSSSL